MMLDRATASYPEPTDPDGKVQQYARPYECDGVLFLPASGLGCGTAVELHSGDLLVQLDLRTETMVGNTLGMFMRLTPEGARGLARHLIENASKVEAHVAEQATAAIEAARKGGGHAPE